MALAQVRVDLRLPFVWLAAADSVLVSFIYRQQRVLVGQRYLRYSLARPLPLPLLSSSRLPTLATVVLLLGSLSAAGVRGWCGW